MNRNLKALYDFLQESSQLADDEKAALLKSVKDVDKELEMALFKLDRTEKVKKNYSHSAGRDHCGIRAEKKICRDSEPGTGN